MTGTPEEPTGLPMAETELSTGSSGPTPPIGDPLLPIESVAGPYSVQVKFKSVGEDTHPQVCYALAHNRVPFVTEMSVRIIDSSVPKKLTIKISGEWAVSERSPIKEAEIVLDAPPSGQSIELSPVHQIQLSDIALADLEELAPATLILEIRDDLGRCQVLRHDLSVFARDQWLSHSDFAVVTAAFVQPNHPDVTQVLTRAGAILAANGTPGLSGYQAASTGQHHRIAEAVFIALQERIDTYINPPASFESLGQKLRPIDRVLEERQGTCIDLACAYASCLEQAGLNPVIFLVRGHAFTGYLADENLPGESVIWSWPAIQSLIDSKLVVSVETVGIPEKLSFEDAISSTQRFLNESMMRSLVDVVRAHQEGIRPLPARVLRDNVITVVIDNGPASPPVVERRDPTTRKLLPESLPARVQSWKNSLLDLSFRNRLLSLRPDRYGLRLIPPIDHLGQIEDFLNNGGTLEVRALDALNEVQSHQVQRGGADELPLAALVEFLKQVNGVFCHTSINRFKNQISRLRSDAALQEEESGANCLYLALGSVKWSANYGDYTSPIFLVPIRIRNLRGLNAALIEMDSNQSTTVNYCLIEALRLREQLTLQWFSDDMSDDLGLDVEAGLESLRREFREKGLDVRGFSVDQTAHIAILDFKKFRLWKDLSDHWKDFMTSPVVNHLVETPRESFKDPVSDALNELLVNDTSVVCAQPADGSQILAVEKALAGATFVLQGPPGSGKSQTITNLLANAMHRGKKVLFVAEKQSALQEVQERLEAVNLGPYCLVLHDSGTKPEDLRSQLRDALDQSPRIDERVYQQFEDDFADAARQLDEYRQNVYAPNAAGLSFASAFFRLGDLGEGPVAEVPRSFLDIDSERVQALQRGLLGLDDLTRPARVGPHHPWSLAGEVVFESIDRPALSSEISSVLKSFAPLSSLTSETIRNAMTSATSLDRLQLIADVCDLRERGEIPSSNDWQKILDPSWITTTERLLADLGSLLNSVGSSLAGHETLLRYPDLDTAVKQIVEAVGSFAIGRKKRVRQSLGVFAPLFNTESLEPESVQKVVKEISAVAQQAHQIVEGMRSMAGLSPMLAALPVTESDVDAVRQRVTVLNRIGAAISIPDQTGGVIRLMVGSSEFPVPGLSVSVRQACEDLRALATRLNATNESIRRWSEGLGVVGSISERSRDYWEESIRTGSFLSLQRWLSLARHLDSYREAGLEELSLSIESGSLAAEDAPKAFERGLLMTTLTVRAEETDLDVFDGTLQNRRVRRFIDLLNQRRENAQAIIPYFLYKSRAINAGVSTGKVGEFRREVNTPTRRRRGRSIRHLIERYPEIIADLTPCFLMSPDSVAQFLPPGTINFDIAVFDEASQIVVADAIGVMGRSKSCVIVGDSKQMPPTSFGVVTSKTDELIDLQSDEAIEEEESILDEAVSAGFHQEMLTWHYRSQDESLIAFSNEHYYDRRLSTFPAPVSFRSDCGIFYVRVNGQFDHGRSQTNEIEANAIVQELIKRLDDPATSNLSYGIVTLNIQQRNLITEILERQDHPKLREIRDSEDKKRRLFVLNLENVQGRERDVIILGTSFSRRAGGGAMPLSFGPLTYKGGERRLNVAVTRAKRQFVVVSSFDPEDMSGANSLGLIHLREYLRSARQRTERELVSSSLGQKVQPQIAELAERLRQKGLQVAIGIGLSNFKVDLALTAPDMADTWLVAVLFDGISWSERPLATDRDALPVIVLENVMGWRRVTRVWMPSLRLELDSVVDELFEQVQLAKKMPAEAMHGSNERTQSPLIPIVQEPREPVVATRVVAIEGQTLPNEQSFESFEFPNVPMDPDLLMTTFAQGILEQLVDLEGPMEAIAALKRVAGAFGLQRVRDSRLAEISVLLSTRQVTQVLDVLYVWPSGTNPDAWRGFRRTTSDVRKVENISPYEIVNAMEVTVRQSITIAREELVKWTAVFFGQAKLTARLREYLEDCLQWGIQSGRFILDGDRLTCA